MKQNGSHLNYHYKDNGLRIDITAVESSVDTIYTTCCTGHINNKNEGTVTMDSTTIKGGGDDDDDDEF